jgi:adenylate cyclase class 2
LHGGVGIDPGIEFDSLAGQEAGHIGPKFARVLLIAGDGDELKAWLAGKPARQPGKPGEFAAAGRAPSGPEVQQGDFANEFRGCPGWINHRHKRQGPNAAADSRMGNCGLIRAARGEEGDDDGDDMRARYHETIGAMAHCKEGGSEVYEVELKFPAGDLAALEQKLVGLAARFADPIDQIDRYFAHPARDFAKTDEALRLRRVGAEVAITWKGPRIDSATKTRREIELPLAAIGPAGSRTIQEWTELLESLGFRQVMEVAKRRRPARVPWHGSDVDVAIDRVEGLGEFVELEVQARQGELPQARSVIESLATDLGCGEQERRSYLELLLAKRPIAR